MISTNNLYSVILAGGKGRRLWPCSRPDMPKQFIDFFGTGRTQLQQTWDRMRKLMPANHIFISTNTKYVQMIQQQLPEAEKYNILAEPLWRNTAPSIVWAAHRIHVFNAESTILVAPSDQQIINEEAFKTDIENGFNFISNRQGLLAISIKPTRPEPGYGYIQLGDHQEGNIYSVQSYAEKPERDFAKMFIESGEFYWNTGMYMIRTDSILHMLHKTMPSVLRSIDSSAKDFTIEDENRYMQENFPSYPNISLEGAILDTKEDIFAMRCEFGWADMGTWHGIYEAEKGASGDNVVLDSDVILDNSKNNIIKVPKGHLAVINGLEGYIVVEKDDILLICPREDSSALIRKYSAEVEFSRQK